jgi:hypothetical protein
MHVNIYRDRIVKECMQERNEQSQDEAHLVSCCRVVSMLILVASVIFVCLFLP